MTKLEMMTDLVRRYPKISPILILKISMAVRGAVISEKAIKRIQEKDLRFTKGTPYGLKFDIFKEDFFLPGSVLFRDGSSVFINYGEAYDDPFTIDYDEELELFLVKEGTVTLDTIYYVPRPEFFDYSTSKGTSMDVIGGNGTTTKIYFNAFQRCRFWEEKNQCHFCALFTSSQVIREPDPEDAYETLMRAIAEPGRFTEIEVSGGSDFGGDPAFSTELERYIRFINCMCRDFSHPVPLRLMAPAYDRASLVKLKKETDISAYKANLEIADKATFKTLCPGKEKWIGYDNWINRLYDAVEVFGDGNVFTNIVAGAELAKPNGMKSIDEAIEANLALVEAMTKHGVSTTTSIWRPHKNERLGWQPMQEPEYYVRLCDGVYDILNSSLILAGMKRRGSDNPEGDLQLGYYAEAIPVEASRNPYDFDDYFVTSLPVDEKITEMLKAGQCYIEIKEIGSPKYIKLDRTPVVKDNHILLPIESDRSTIFSYLIKKLWRKSGLALILTSGENTIRISVEVRRNHMLGKTFKEIYLNSQTDLAAVIELTVTGVTVVSEVPDFTNNCIDNISLEATKHLENQLL